MPKAQPLKSLEMFAYSQTVSKKIPPESGYAAKQENEQDSGGAVTNKPIAFPRGESERDQYRTASGKKLTPYQWAVYDLILRIPEGQVTTYKVVAEAAGGSARSAGSALRVNPFSPYVPCHRVVASNLFIGGFFGKWAGKQKSQGSSKGMSMGGEQIEIKKKIALLQQEGVSVDGRGFLVNKKNLLWTPPTRIEI